MFQAVGLDRSILLKDEYLQKVFDMIDTDNKGYFVVDQLKAAFLMGQEDQEDMYANEIWQFLFDQGDINRNGRIYFNDFADVML